MDRGQVASQLVKLFDFESECLNLPKVINPGLARVVGPELVLQAMGRLKEGEEVRVCYCLCKRSMSRRHVLAARQPWTWRKPTPRLKLWGQE